MKKHWLGVALVLGFVAMLLLPTSAFATTKAATAFRSTRSEYVIARGSTDTTVAGVLIYRKVVVRSHRKVLADAPLVGRVYLDRADDSSGEYVNVTSTVSSKTGHFSFLALSGGDYRLRFNGSKATHAASREVEVLEDALSISSLGASATLEPDGHAFVTISAYMSGPAGAITTASPALAVLGAERGPTIGPLGDPFELPPSLLLLVYGTTISHDDTCQAGFSVPSSSFDQTITLVAGLDALDGYYVSASKITSFTVSSLLGP